ncbi:MAG: hypothetical protein CMM01_26045 [Rhodopirellula sp.]|nr:hypothetical protein [Rhodopirellula sp.]
MWVGAVLGRAFGPAFSCLTVEFWRSFVKQPKTQMKSHQAKKKAFHICGDVKRLFDEAFRIIVSYFS